MSKNGGICSVKSKKKYKKIFSNLYDAAYAHLGIPCTTRAYPLIYKASRCFSPSCAIRLPDSAPHIPCVSMGFGVFSGHLRVQWNTVNFHVARGLCEDYATEVPDNVSSIGHAKSTHPHLSACRIHGWRPARKPLKLNGFHDCIM